MIDTSTIAQLIEQVGHDAVLHQAADIEPWLSDRRGIYRGQAQAVIRPRTVQQVAACMKVCQATGTPVVPRGGNTGLCGGADARDLVEQPGRGVAALPVGGNPVGEKGRVTVQRRHGGSLAHRRRAAGRLRLQHVQRRVEPFDDFSGRAFGCQQPEPCFRRIAGQRIADGHNAGQQRRRLCEP